MNHVLILRSLLSFNRLQKNVFFCMHHEGLLMPSHVFEYITQNRNLHWFIWCSLQINCLQKVKGQKLKQKELKKKTKRCKIIDKHFSCFSLSLPSLWIYLLYSLFSPSRFLLVFLEKYTYPFIFLEKYIYQWRHVERLLLFLTI